MKVVIIGGGAPSTPALFEFLASRTRLPKLHFVSLGPTERNLAAVGRASRLLAASRAISIETVVSKNDDWERSLTGADAILMQARIGGYAGRAVDESVPLKYGISGDSSFGPGGASAGWRSWPQLKNYFLQIAKWAPRALVIVMSSPVGILVRLARDVAPQLNVVGICEMPAAILENICIRLQVPVSEVSHDYCGINHLGWFYSVRHEARNLIAAYLRLFCTNVVELSLKNIAKSFHAIPTRYWRCVLSRELAVAQQREVGSSRSKFLSQFAQQAITTYQGRGMASIRQTLHQRAAPWYPMAVGPIILGLAGLTVDETFYLTTADEALNRELRLKSNDVLEMPFRFSSGRLSRCPCQARIPKPVANLLVSQVRFEREVSQAILQRDRLQFCLAIARSTGGPPGGEISALVDELLGDGTV